jgi:hypothetical protein
VTGAGALVLALALAGALTGCESTQTKSARLERAAQGAEKERGLVVSRLARSVAVERTTLLQDANGAAAVVELRNRSRRSLVGLPLAVQVRDKARRSLYANDAAGLDSSLVRVPALAARGRLAWVDDQVTLAARGRDVVARVGAGAVTGPARLPRIEVSGMKPSGDASGDLAVVGEVVNRSEVEQRRLVVFVVGRRGSRIVAAGRAIVARLAPGSRARFSAFPIGDPRGAQLAAAAPPTVVAAP